MFSCVLTVVWPRLKTLRNSLLLTICVLFMVPILFLLTFQGCGQGIPLLCAVSHLFWSFYCSSSCLCHFCRTCSARITCGIWSLEMLLKQHAPETEGILFLGKSYYNPEYSSCFSLKERSTYIFLLH